MPIPPTSCTIVKSFYERQFMTKYNYKQIAMLVDLFVEENDSNAFAQLYGLTYNKIYNYACYYLKDPYLAQDALQEIYIQVMKKLPDLKEPQLFLSWLGTIAFHVCYDISTRKSRTELSSSELLTLLNLADVHDTPEEHCTRDARRKLVKQAIGSLPLLDQQIIVLRYYNDLTMEAISSACCISLSSCKRHHNAALKQIKKYLEERE